jgi:hypothetical protein
MSGAIPLLFQYAFIARTEKILHYYVGVVVGAVAAAVVVVVVVVIVT